MATSTVEAAHADKHRKPKVKELAVAVVTTAGIFPGEDTLVRVEEDLVVKAVLEKAAAALDIKDYSDWEAHADGRQLDIAQSFERNHLKCVVEIDWHKPEGGGGA